MLQDIAILTGGQVVSEEVGLKLETADISVLGQAKSVKIDKDNTTIVGGAGEKSVIADRVAEIKKQLKNLHQLTTRSSFRSVLQNLQVA